MVEALDDGPILFIHDDVAIDDLSLSRLVSAHLDGATVAVPNTNDMNSEQFHGTLPPAGVARAELKRLALERREPVDQIVEKIDSIRPTCLVTSKASLRSLLDHRVHDPFAQIRDRGMGFHLVGGAFAAHDAVCGHQVRSRSTDDERPLLVASMIVKDEEELLGGCLESLSGLVDRIEVVDTGSTDQTIAIASAHGANVSQMKWTDDFSEARNVAADQCRDAIYTLWIDADERMVVDDVDLIRDLLTVNKGAIEAFDVSIVNRNRGEGTDANSVFRARRIVAAELLEFTGRIHERPTRRGSAAEPLDAVDLDLLSIDHLGYAAEVDCAAVQGRTQRQAREGPTRRRDFCEVLCRSRPVADDGWRPL